VVGVTLGTTAVLADWLAGNGTTDDWPVVGVGVGDWLGLGGVVAAGGGGGGATGAAVVSTGTGTDEM
jgi:hypothetical protein